MTLSRKNPLRRNSSPVAAVTLARGLGWFSIALGLAEVLAPGVLSRSLGMGRWKMLVAGYGVREIAAGVGILASEDPAPWIWGRVAGDALDLGTLAAALLDDNPQKAGVAVAMAAVAGVTALDVVCAQALGTKARRSSLRWGYNGRRGMPRPAEAVRGLTQNLGLAPNVRTPEAIRRFAGGR